MSPGIRSIPLTLSATVLAYRQLHRREPRFQHPGGCWHLGYTVVHRGAADYVIKQIRPSIPGPYR